VQFFLIVHDDVPSGMRQNDFPAAMCLTCMAWTVFPSTGTFKCTNCGGLDFVFVQEKGIKLDSYQLKQLVDDSMS
jgi:hypothetical protein